MSKRRLAVITTHPIQYYAPLFKLLAARQNIELKVFYTWGDQAKGEVFDRGFGKAREWDIPLLKGYEYEFVTNISTSPGSNHFRGIINPDLINRIKEYQATAILIYGWAFHSHLKVMRYFKHKLPVFFRGDSTLLDERQGFSIEKILRRFFLTWVYRHIDYAFYVGSNNLKYFTAHGLVLSQLFYTPHAIDNYRFSDNALQFEGQADKWRSALNIPPDTPVILFAGKLDQNKNGILLITAAKVISNMHFIIVGNGSMENKMKQASKKLRNVTILPFQNQSLMPVVYRLSDIFVLLSNSETWGLAINEAMACGRIVIASNRCGGAIDLIEDGINGYIINPDIHSFTEALQKLGADKANYRRLKENSLEKIKNFSFKKIAETIEDLMLDKV